MTRTRVTLLALLFLLVAPTWAHADATMFIGATTTGGNRAVKGVAIGFGLLLVGFEFEYANTPDDPTTATPALKTGMANLLLQTPFEIFGFQPYVTAGGGLYRESLEAQNHLDTSIAIDTGGGV